MPRRAQSAAILAYAARLRSSARKKRARRWSQQHRARLGSPGPLGAEPGRARSQRFIPSPDAVKQHTPHSLCRQEGEHRTADPTGVRVGTPLSGTRGCVPDGAPSRAVCQVGRSLGRREAHPCDCHTLLRLPTGIFFSTPAGSRRRCCSSTASHRRRTPGPRGCESMTSAPTRASR